MSEFNFDGGSRDGPGFYHHYQARQDGMPRIGSPVELPAESAQFDEHTRSAPAAAREATICGVPAVCEDLPPAPLEIQVGMTVWLELSRGGPFKVVARYEHPLGAEVQAHHPHDAPNTFERVRVREALWLCQDSKGVVHILAAGALTDRQPKSRFSRLNRGASWIWGRREVALWSAIAGMAAKICLA